MQACENEEDSGFLYMYMYIHIYIHICTYTYTCIHTYIHTHIESNRDHWFWPSSPGLSTGTLWKLWKTHSAVAADTESTIQLWKSCSIGCLLGLLIFVTILRVLVS